MSELTVGRTPVVYVQLFYDKCTRTYGSSPCLAATPANKCYNTLATCQYKSAYNTTGQALLFGKPQSDLPRDINIIPLLTSVTTAPTKINPSTVESNSSPLGQRAVATIKFKDAPYSDLLTDPYLSSRSFNPLTKGTFWSKWLARNPYYQNRVVIIYEGYLGQSLASMNKRYYLIDSISGPDSSGNVTLVAKDPLKLADKYKAVVPAISTGKLAFDLSLDAQHFIVKNAVEADYFAFNGTVRIDDEIIRYSSTQTINISGIDYVQFDGCTRGSDGSSVEQHNADTNVQECLRYTDALIESVIHDLLISYAKVPPEYIDYFAWIAEASEWLRAYNVTTLITEPTGISTLIGELAEQVMFYLWWDEREAQIKFKAIRPSFTEIPLITDELNIIENSFSMTVDTKNRISQSWVYWNQKNRGESVDKASNYQQIEVAADLDAESAIQYDESKIRKVYARWIQSEAQASELAYRLMTAWKDNPKYIKFRLDAKDRAIWTGDIIDVEHRSIVDFNGNKLRERYQVLSAEEIVSGETIEYTAQNYTYYLGRFGFYMASDAPSFASATPEQKLGESAWYAGTNGLMSDGTDGWEYM